MTIDPTILSAIESVEKTVLLGSLGSRRQFERAMLKDPDVAKVLEGVCSQEGAIQVANRIRAFSSLEVSPEYQHPHDIAMAIYLRSLDITQPELAETLAPHVARLPNIWWARPIALRLLNERRTDSFAQDRLIALRFPNLFVDETSTHTSSASRESYPDFQGSFRFFRPRLGKSMALQQGSVARWPGSSEGRTKFTATGSSVSNLSHLMGTH